MSVERRSHQRVDRSGAPPHVANCARVFSIERQSPPLRPRVARVIRAAPALAGLGGGAAQRKMLQGMPCLRSSIPRHHLQGCQLSCPRQPYRAGAQRVTHSRAALAQFPCA